MMSGVALCCWAALIVLPSVLVPAYGYQKPTAAYAPLFTGVIKLADVPAYAAPGSPAIISPRGRRRRLSNFPTAPELSTGILERLTDGSASDNGGRRLHELQQQYHHQQDPIQHEDISSTTAQRVSTSTRRLQQLPEGADSGGKYQRRTGWSGLWWAEAGGVGLAVGPNHVVHAMSTVVAVYTVDPATGNKQDAKVIALQDLFAPVGAANCKEGVYDAIPIYDKHANRFLITATCSGKGAVLLAASSTSDATGSWFLFNLIADAAGTYMACKDPLETAIAESVRASYNTDGVYLSLFNYCPSKPQISGAAILALPKHKVYKGAPNFVYGVFSADQIWLALQPDQQDPQVSMNSDPRLANLGANSFRQCQPAPPVTAEDAAGGTAYFVCDHVGPDAGQPRNSYTLVSILNTGALWQYAGTRETSPTPVLVATLVDRGRHAPLSYQVMLQQPQGGSKLHAGGTTPAGFWSGSAVLSGGKVYTVDRTDLTNADVQPPATPVSMPSLMWMEVNPKVLLTGGDCTSTTAWGSKWDWKKDWSIDWGKDFDLEWTDNKKEAEDIQQHIKDIEAQMRELIKQCMGNATVTAAAAAVVDGSSSSDGYAFAAATEIGDGSVGTIAGSSSGDEKLRNCTAAAAASVAAAMSNTSSSSSSSSDANTPLRLRKLAAVHGGSSSSMQQHTAKAASSAAAAAAAAKAAASSSRYALHWTGTPFPSFSPAAVNHLMHITHPSSSSSSGSGGGSSNRHLTQVGVNVGVGGVGVNVFVGWDVGCWYCTGAGGVYYSSSWFYRYWYAQWDFGWYKRFKANYAPGWRHPTKWIGRRHMLQTTTDDVISTAAAAAVAQLFNASLMAQNDSIVIPPCLQTGQSYKNTCEQCKFNNVTAKVTVDVTRTGVISRLGPNPLGFVAPVISVIPGGEIVILAGYSGPDKLPDSNMPAYPGIASLTVSANSTEAAFKVIRPGIGKVRSRTGRWSDFSAADLTLLPNAAAAASSDGSMAAAPRAKLYFGVQWSQRVVRCFGVPNNGTVNNVTDQPVCGMPGPWLGQMTL